ncbi:MAG TPA: lamin tail domain-containing protein [Candidatus Omnitrophota bacterium]|nr:lamin tail domain-containing protein [Candidatus Omnitrophota bacterium]
MRGRIMLVLLFVLLVVAPRAQAFVVINEIFADPAAGLAGDANGDGVRSQTDDEFLEILNFTDQSVNLSGWTLKDAVSTRHVFPANTFLSPYQFLVVFGGGSPNLPGINWQLASTGGLSLNNTLETVTLSDLNNQVIDQITYGNLANQDRSIVRFPEATGNFVLHSSLAQANGALFSPGKSIDGRSLAPSTVPEPSSLSCLLLGALALIRRRPGRQI